MRLCHFDGSRKIECSPDEAKKILDQMIPDAQIEDLLELFEKYDEKDTPKTHSLTHY